MGVQGAVAGGCGGKFCLDFCWNPEPAISEPRPRPNHPSPRKINLDSPTLGTSSFRKPRPDTPLGISSFGFQLTKLPPEVSTSYTHHPVHRAFPEVDVEEVRQSVWCRYFMACGSPRTCLLLDNVLGTRFFKWPQQRSKSCVPKVGPSCLCRAKSCELPCTVAHVLDTRSKASPAGCS